LDLIGERGLQLVVEELTQGLRVLDDPALDQGLDALQLHTRQLKAVSAAVARYAHQDPAELLGCAALAHLGRCAGLVLLAELGEPSAPTLPQAWLGIEAAQASLAFAVADCWKLPLRLRQILGRAALEGEPLVAALLAVEGCLASLRPEAGMGLWLPAPERVALAQERLGLDAPRLALVRGRAEAELVAQGL
jgi:hypothetical protein